MGTRFFRGPRRFDLRLNVFGRALTIGLLQGIETSCDLKECRVSTRNTRAFADRETLLLFLVAQCRVTVAHDLCTFSESMDCGVSVAHAVKGRPITAVMVGLRCLDSWKE